MEPEVSVPNATGAKPQATPTADPVDEPAGVYEGVSVLVRRGHLKDLQSRPWDNLRSFNLLVCMQVRTFHPRLTSHSHPYSRQLRYDVRNASPNDRNSYVRSGHTSFPKVPKSRSIQSRNVL